MSLTTRAMALATHAFFAREGDAFTTPAPGTVGRNDKPDADDDVWIEPGTIEESEDSIVDEDEVKLWKPSPGHLVPNDIITLKQGLQIKFTTNEMSPLAVEAFYRTSQLLDESSEVFNPLSSVPRKGWLKLQRYTERDEAQLVLDVWGRLKVTGGMKMGGAIIKPEFEFYVLYSQYNVAGLSF